MLILIFVGFLILCVRGLACMCGYEEGTGPPGTGAMYAVSCHVGHDHQTQVLCKTYCP